MNAPTQPISARPLAEFTAACADVIAMRHTQVQLGHTASADDTAGPTRLSALALGQMRLAAADLQGDPERRWACMGARERAATRRRLIRAAALAIATVDVIDRTGSQP